MKSYAESMRLYEKALCWTPNASQTGSKAPGKAGPLGGYPLFLRSGRDAHVTDVDGHSYIDLIASLAAVGLGHGDVTVCSAVEEALYSGALLSLPTEREAQASEMLCKMTGWATQARWVKTGSEATEAAVRIARAARKRALIATVQTGYHAWHSWFQAVKPEHPGVPDTYTDAIIGLPYGHYDRWAETLASDKVAAVILEPAPITGGGDGDWLRWLVQTAHEHGTLVIFDEIVWGLRLSESGGTGRFGIQPDLATYGKALGNGIPVAAVVGRMEVMQQARLVSGTFGGDQLGLAAAIAVLGVYEQHRIVGTMWERGNQLQRLLAPLRFEKVQFSCHGYAVHPVFEVHADGVEDGLAMSFFLQRLAEYGVLYHPAGGNIIAALTAEEVSTAVIAISKALSDLSDAVAEGPLRLAGDAKPYQQAFARARA